MNDKKVRIKFMRLLNANIDDLRDNPKYKTAKDILHIDEDSEYVINSDMFEYENEKREDTKEQNVLIIETKKIGKNILKEDKKGVSNYKMLYSSLNKHPAFNKFFEHKNLTMSDMLDFGTHIANFKTKSMEQHEKQNEKLRKEKEETLKEIEKLKGENEEKTNKIESLKKSVSKAKKDSSNYSEQINNLNKQIEDERKQAEEDKRTIKAEANRDKNEKIAQMKNKLEERHEKDKEALLEETQRNQKEIYGFAPNLEAYIKKKLAAQAYSLDEDELIDKIARDIGKPGGLPTGTDPKLVAKAIYDRGAEETLKHIKKISNLAILTGYNNDLYNKLPGDVAQEVQKYITDKIQDDIRKKNIKYILPKDKPRWEYAMQTKNLNPMLGRSAWRVN